MWIKQVHQLFVSRGRNGMVLTRQILTHHLYPINPQTFLQTWIMPRNQTTQLLMTFHQKFHLIQMKRRLNPMRDPNEPENPPSAFGSWFPVKQYLMIDQN